MPRVDLAIDKEDIRPSNFRATIVGVGPVHIRPSEVVDVTTLLQRKRNRKAGPKRLLIARVRRLEVPKFGTGLVNWELCTVEIICE